MCLLCAVTLRVGCVECYTAAEGYVCVFCWKTADLVCLSRINAALDEWHSENRIYGVMQKSLKTIIMSVFCATLLAGCMQADANIYGCCVGQKVVGNKNYVTVWNVWSEMSALPLAEAHCEEYKRTAKFDKMEGIRAIFECVD